MKKILGSWLLLGLVSTAFCQSPHPPGIRRGLELYQRARTLFERSDPTPTVDSLALRLYQQAFGYLGTGYAYAAQRFDCQEKIGILHQSQGQPALAIPAYQQALATVGRYRLPDSLRFKPYLYCGSAYYALDAFDSALVYFEKAEQIFLRYPRLPEAERLYNSFGVMYYELSNYKQSVNYFRKALQVHEKRGPEDQQTVYTFTSNIASAMRHLDRPDSALALYRSLLPLALKSDELYLNLGTIFLERHQPDSALHYLRRVRSPARRRSLVYGNLLAEATWQRGQGSAARAQLIRLLGTHTGPKPGLRNRQLGLTYQLLGNVERERGDGLRALAYYQESIRALSNQFDNADVGSNPERFSEVFRGFTLYESLIAKAQCFAQLYDHRADSRRLAQAAGAYESAFRLVEHIKKTYATEEARLFLSGKVFADYRAGVALMVRAFQVTHQPTYLHRAFGWSEQSKASTLFINLQENRVKSAAIPDSLQRREARLRSNLSRLLMKIDRTASDAELEPLLDAVRDHELALARLMDRLNEYPDYYANKFRADTLDLPRLRRLLGTNRIVLSYFDGGDRWHGFVLGAGGIRYFSVGKSPGLDAVLRRFVREVHTQVPGQPYRGHALARVLYAALVRPARLSPGDAVVLIPHQALAALPFEALEDGRGRYLLAAHALTYQYSALFLREQHRQNPVLTRSLAVAPFGGDTPTAAFPTLPASLREITPLGGSRLVSARATKANVLAGLGRASVVHLATHAVSDHAQPLRSHVAFFPDTTAEFRWYASEIQLASLRHVQLVFLSACDSGDGPLLGGEGIMSLSRAFSYAGCPNLITSLWKAEDETTSYLSTRFYEHLRRGTPYEAALRQAKLDLLGEARLVQFQTPPYWAHLVFIGNPLAGHEEQTDWVRWLVLAVLVGLAGVLVPPVFNRLRRKVQDAHRS